MAECLDCGAELHGRYCAACGQRVTPPYPTMREMLIDAWHEFTVFDSRLLRTGALLVRHPGRLTHEYLAGRRSRYLPPLRLYLIASVAYFLIAAVAPPSKPQNTSATLPGKGNVKIDLLEPRVLTPEERAAAMQSVERAPWFMKPLFHRLVEDPLGVRRNMIAAMPKVFFVLVPVFAGIVALFYWRPFPQHLVFSLHLHAAIFTALAVQQLANLTKTTVIMAIVQFAVMVFVVTYTLLAFRRTYENRWWRVLLKSAGIAVLYLASSIVALLTAFVWAALF